MADTGFCTKCGAARAADARFCTACGASLSGAAAAPRSGAATKPAPAAAIVVGVLFLAVGGAAAYIALREPAKAERAVAGKSGVAAGAPSGEAPSGEDGLPTGHPSIELPKEVVAFLDSLTAEAEKDPKSVDAAQKLTRARYRASVINASYRASAEQALAKLLALDPANTEGLRIAANLAYDAGDFPEAQKRFEAFLAKNPDDASALTDLGSVMLFQDKAEEGAKLYQKAIAKDPKFMQAHFNLGIAEQKRGRTAEATASLKRALELATTPEEKQHVENALAEVEGREPMKIAGAGEKAAPKAPPAAAPPGQMQGGMPMPPPAADRDVPTNASSDFQRKAEKPLVTHPIVGPRVAGFEWTGPATLRAKIADFPMDQMPPFARAKFKTGMTEKLAAVAKNAGVAGPVTVELVDHATGRVMDTLRSDEAATGATPPASPSAAPPAPDGTAR